eukprot:CAMPEP_0197534374 /NCGR_PEP_ID=MMETSP1318-20131121/46937_1 /TAXON_ID=552666 /ORGANISM="Partenskyella glossopodia, Strain RCC365" /LENGTH=124 /DNA_ID=CAMNT_0043091617 /DNA_START=15 /DNA_END=389 /DNA_ORIENTATION=+
MLFRLLLRSERSALRSGVQMRRNFSSAVVVNRYMLVYDYVEDVLEKRTPHRPGHLQLIKEGMEAGNVIMAGALANPPDKAYIVMSSEEAAAEFSKVDPYVLNGVVTSYSIREWNTVEFLKNDTP